MGEACPAAWSPRSVSWGRKVKTLRHTGVRVAGSLFLIIIPTGVGKTSLLRRYVKGTFDPPLTTSTIGASFLTKRVLDVDSGTTVRLQLWDTAGQERFHSITKLYYRGASAVVLVYSIIDEQSFEEMGRWLMEMKENVGEDVVIHVVGTKSDLVAQDPGLRQIAFERCIAFVADNLFPEQATTPPPLGLTPSTCYSLDGTSKRSSGFWGQDIGWDCCHEISSSSGEGIEEVFRVITRKLVEQNIKKAETDPGRKASVGGEDLAAGQLDGAALDGRGSFRVGIGDKRRSWLGLAGTRSSMDEEPRYDVGAHPKARRKACC